ncbi:peptide ABC transporter substrate-binding protein [Halotalea alkalilenta]|uniref:peptide ABC transporter substrate-binding protein n=1 Tax=Halotalea alkalilenta TaxID=376489 RepID=UPI000694431B|nr:peptide ABC transporter substrate-binding protein [Halotalea alkalilenta]
MLHRLSSGLSSRARSLRGPITGALLLGLLPFASVQAATIHIANGAEPGTLDPQKASGDWETRITRELFEPLLGYDAQGELIPGLAARWEVSDDGKTYRFHLREAQWSDGREITAADAVFALRRLLAPQTAAYNANLYYPIEGAEAVNRGEATPDTLGVEALDERTLEIRLTQPTAYFLQAMAMTESAPLPEHYIDQALDQPGARWVTPGELVVSGAFQLTAWTPQSEIRLEKNPGYYAADQVKLDTAVLYPLDDAQAALNRFRTAEIDISYLGVPSSQIGWARENLAHELRINPILGEYYYVLNQREGSKLADKRVREALNLAVRREVITDTILGMGQIPSYWYLPRAMSGDAGGTMGFMREPLEQRLERAHTLLAEAGYGPGEPLELEIAYNTLEDHRKVAVAIAAMWRAIGVETRLTNRETAVHFATLRQGDFQVGRYGAIATVDDPFDLLSSFVTGASGNYSGYANPAYDQLVARSTAELDPARRAELLTEAQQLLLDDYAMVPLYDYVSTKLVSDRVQGWQSNPLDVHPLRYMSITE